MKRILVPLTLASVTVLPLLHFVGMKAMEQSGSSDSVAVEPSHTSESNKPIATKPKDIWAATVVGDVPAIRDFLVDADVNRLDPIMGQSPLSLAALFGQTAAVELLIENGADVNLRSRDQGTALHNAAFLGRADVVELLVKSGADVLLINRDGVTAKQTLQANWALTKMIAQMVRADIDRAELEAGRRLIAPILTAAEAAANEPVASGPMSKNQNRVRRTAAIRGLMQAPTLGHLWFLAHLCWLVLAFAAYATVANRLNWSGLPDSVMLSPMRYLWLIPLTLLPQWWMQSVGFGPDTAAGLLPKPAVLAFYAVFFFVGAIYWDSDDRSCKIGRFWWGELPLAMLLMLPLGLEFSMGLFGFGDRLIPSEYHGVASDIVQVLYAWMMTFAGIGIVSQLFPRENSRIRFISDSSYWLYLAHLPLVMWGQMMIRDWDASPFLKFALLCFAVSAVLLLSYRYLVRYTWIGVMLNGPRKFPTAEETPAA